MTRLLIFYSIMLGLSCIPGEAQYYDSTTDTEAATFVDSVEQSVGSDHFQKISRIYAFMLAKTLGQLDRNILTPAAFVEHVEQAEQVRTRFYQEINTVNFRTYLLPYRIRSENCTADGWRKVIRDKLTPMIIGISDPKAAALTVLTWCKAKVRMSEEDRCYPLGLKGDLDPLTTLDGGVGSEIDLSILAVAALRSVGVAARLVTAPVIAGEAGGKVWVEYRSEGKWNTWVASAPDRVDGKQYLLDQFRGRFGLILANPEEPINITSTYVAVAHLDVTLSNVEAENRPGWNLLVFGKNQLSPITGRNIYTRLSDNIAIGPGNYLIVAGDRIHESMIMPISINEGEYGSYVMDISKKGAQSFTIAQTPPIGSYDNDTQEMDTAITINPSMW
jgi:hypothetical protein